MTPETELLVNVYVPEADCLSAEEAETLAKLRDEEAAAQLKADFDAEETQLQMAKAARQARIDVLMHELGF